MNSRLPSRQETGTYKKPIGDQHITQRRIVANPKYEGVQATLDNGITVNLAKQISDTTVSVKQQKGELFRRVRPATVVNFIEWKQSQERLAQMQGGVQQYHQQDQYEQQQYGGNDPAYAQQQQFTGGAPPMQQQQHNNNQPDYANQQNFQGFPVEDFMVPQAPKKELLILDVRDREDYEYCHIQGAIHYPAAKLTHSMNPFTPEVLAFKNKDNKTIVIYDLEEEIVIGRKVGNIFFEKGCDNIVIISGGLREFVQLHSAYIVGESPVPIAPKAPPRVSRAREEMSERASTSNRSTLAHSTATSHKPKSLASSLARRAPSTSGWR